jgi:hypothetical protein
MSAIIPQVRRDNATNRYRRREQWTLIPHSDRIFIQAIRRDEDSLKVNFFARHGWCGTSALYGIIRQLSRTTFALYRL